MSHQAGHVDTVPQNVDEWMNASNSSNPLDNLARVNAKLASLIGEVINLQSAVVRVTGDKIKRISDINVRIKGLQNQLDTKPDAVSLLGANYAESEAILKELKAVGVKNMDYWLSYHALNNLTTNKPLIFSNAWAGQISLELQALNESEQNRSQQESLRLQTFTNRYTQANDQASSVIQKDSQGKGTVTSNLRGAGG